MKVKNGENFKKETGRRSMTAEEKLIYNHGERLVFGVSHNVKEDIRHRSSYLFFREIINCDLQLLEDRQIEIEKISICDLGCGVGHGCETLAAIKSSIVSGIDSCPDAIEYASRNYSRENILYNCQDLQDYIPAMPRYDYIVSRGVLEHISNGLKLGLAAKWSRRLIFDLPYNEPSGRNPHHILYGITEKSFAELAEANSYMNMELFYQDLQGIIYNKANKPEKPNMIICICSNPLLPEVNQIKLEFPIPAWQP